MTTREIFYETKKGVSFIGIELNISKGFIDIDDNFIIYTDHEIFEHYHQYNLRNSFSKSESLTLKELTNLKIGDFVTHIDDGIGKFYEIN